MIGRQRRLYRNRRHVGLGPAGALATPDRTCRPQRCARAGP